MKPPGTFDGKEYWTRCPFCGDSERDQQKAHFSFQLSGVYHCYRCKSSGVFSPAEIAQRLPAMLAAQVDAVPEPTTRVELDLEMLQMLMQPGPGTSRQTALPRQHIITNGKTYDVFTMRQLNGVLTGFHLRHLPTRTMRSLGVTSLGYAAEDRFSPPDLTIRIVEGPYDVVDPAHDVCTFGLPGKNTLQKLQGLGIILCPDGDVWNNYTLFTAYFRQVLAAEIFLLAIEIIKDLDPEEVPIKHREVQEGPLLPAVRALAQRFFPGEYDDFKKLLDRRGSRRFW